SVCAETHIQQAIPNSRHASPDRAGSGKPHVKATANGEGGSRHSVCSKWRAEMSVGTGTASPCSLPCLYYCVEATRMRMNSTVKKRRGRSVARGGWDLHPGWDMAVLARYGMDENERRLRQEFLALSETDKRNVRQLREVFALHAKEFAERFYQHLLSNPVTAE